MPRGEASFLAVPVRGVWWHVGVGSVVVEKGCRRAFKVAVAGAVQVAARRKVQVSEEAEAWARHTHAGKQEC